MASFTESYLEIVSGRRRGLAPCLMRAGLRTLSWPYALAAAARNTAYDRGWARAVQATVPVVSVGNLTLGGTGKTPCVEAVARFYRELDIRVAILSRGYGATASRNDEALVLEENLPDVPHLQGTDRAALAATAVEELECELLILDDGFQHRRLHRDLDIVLIDATRPPTLDHLFPRGTLRERLGSLRRAGVIVLTRCDQVAAKEVEDLAATLNRRFPMLPVARTVHRPIELIGLDGVDPIPESTDRPVAAFCGIGNPTAFRRTLEQMSMRVSDFRVFPDHHAYTRKDVDDLARWAGELPPDTQVLTTQKDWVKLRVEELGGRPLRAVRIGLTFLDGQAEFEAVLSQIAPVCLTDAASAT